MQLESPVRPNTAAIFNLGAGGIAQHLTNVYQKGGDSPFTIKAVQQVSATGSSKPIYLVVYSDDSVSKVNASFVALTDVDYTVGQTVPSIWNYIAAQNGSAGEFQFEARLVPPTDVDRQYIVAYPLTAFIENPSYPDIVQMGNTLTFTH